MRLKNVFIWIVVFSFYGKFAGAETAREQKIIGLLEIPTIFGTPDLNGPPGQVLPKKAGILKLQAEPDEKSKVIIEVMKSDDLMSQEHGYGERSAIAYNRKGDWFLIKSKSKMGWLAPQYAGKFHSYEDLIKNGLSYLDQNWDGRIYSSPDNPKGIDQRMPSKEKQDIKILEAKLISGRLWFQIQLIDGRCEGEENLGKKGWVPAYKNGGLRRQLY